MKNSTFNNNFIQALQKKFSQRAELSNILENILGIEKEAVYRRLRGEVAFTFNEVGSICHHLAISLDEILGVYVDKIKPFRVHDSDFQNPSKTDYVLWEDYHRLLEVFTKHPPFYIYELCNSIPFSFCCKFPLLLQFYIFKWSCQVEDYHDFKPFEEIKIEEKVYQLQSKTLQMWMQATESHYILSDDIFQNLIKDWKFLSGIKLISKMSLEELKKVLMIFLNYLEELTISGKYPESGNNVYFYISETLIQTNFHLLHANENYFSMFRTMVNMGAFRTDEKTFLFMKNWFNAIKRLSIPISLSGEKERISFFARQRQMILAL